MRRFLSFEFRLWGLFTAAGALAFVGTVLGFLGSLWWFLDHFSHFRPQYLIFLAVIAAILALGRKWKQSAIVGIFALPNLALVLPLYLGPGSQSPVPGHGTIRILLANVNTKGGDPGKVLGLVEEVDPDILILEEISGLWVAELSILRDLYPHRKVEPRWDNFGIGIYSKLPIEDVRIIPIGDADVPSVFARMEIDGEMVHIFATHPPPPGPRHSTLYRNRQLQEISDFLGKLPRPLILVGDLNATPWSHPFRKLRKETGLLDSTRGFGFQPTWPTDFPPLWVPIDHFLHTEEIRIIDRRTGPGVGSDHYPLIVDFQVIPG